LIKHMMIAAVAAATPLVAAGTAQAAELPAPEVAFVQDNVVVAANRAEATVLAKYRCYGGEEGTHLWVSAKQGENLEAEGSSAWATAWYDTNYQYAENPAGQTIDCDGHWHATRFTIKRVEGKGLLKPGSVWVQFCVFDSQGGFGSVSAYKTVRIGA
jgi:hypothetical protein